MLANYTIEGFENIQYQGYQTLHTIENKLSRLFRLYGYQPISTPTFEAYDLFTTEESIPSDDLFKLVNHQGKVLALKPDATIPVARMAAINHKNPNDIIKFSYLTNIYRNFSSSEIIKKEQTQMGVEYFGNNSPECDGEIIAIAIEALAINGIDDVHIDLGHVGFIGHLLDELLLSPIDRNRLFQFIETKNISDIREFLSIRHIDGEIASIILELPMLYGEPQKVFTKMEKLCINEAMVRVLDKLKAIYHHLKVVGLEKYVSFDLGFTSQMNYYSDMIFKGYISNWGEPVLSGGRYNNLSKKFGIDRPACGFGIDILKLMEYMEQNDLLPEDDTSKMVLIYRPEDKCACFNTAALLRDNGIPTEMFLIRSTPEECVAALRESILYQNADFYLVSEEQICQWQQAIFAPVELFPNTSDVFRQEDN